MMRYLATKRGQHGEGRDDREPFRSRRLPDGTLSPEGREFLTKAMGGDGRQFDPVFKGGGMDNKRDGHLMQRTALGIPLKYLIIGLVVLLLNFQKIRHLFFSLGGGLQSMKNFKEGIDAGEL